jgi:hypothetical protein
MHYYSNYFIYSFRTIIRYYTFSTKFTIIFIISFLLYLLNFLGTIISIIAIKPLLNLLF